MHITVIVLMSLTRFRMDKDVATRALIIEVNHFTLPVIYLDFI